MGRNKSIKILLLIFIVIIFYLLGYLRNYIFLFLNADAASIWYNEAPLIPPHLLGFTTGMSYEAIERLKWILTFTFYLLFFSVTLITIYLLFRNKVYLRLCAFLYGVLLFISFLFVCTGYAIHNFAMHAYNISRSLMHIGQSPFIPLLLFIIIYYHHQVIPPKRS